MAPDPRILSAVALATFVFGLAAAVVLHRRRRTSGLAGPLAWWAAGVAVWAFGEGVLSYWTALPLGVQRAGQYAFLVGGSLVLVGGCGYVLALSGSADLDTPRTRFLVVAPFLSAALLGVLDGRWHLVYRSLEREPGQMWHYQPGPLFVVMLGWGLVVLTAVSAALAATVVQSLDERRGWTTTAAGALFGPSVVMALVSTIPSLQWASSYAAPILGTTLVLWWFVERAGQRRDLVLVNAGQVLRQVSDALIVLDPARHVLETNPAALLLLLQPGEGSARRPDLREVLDGLGG